MPLPQGPLPAGTKVRIQVELEVVRDDGDAVACLIPSGLGGVMEALVLRAALEAGEVVSG